MGSIFFMCKTVVRNLFKCSVNWDINLAIAGIFSCKLAHYCVFLEFRGNGYCLKIHTWPEVPESCSFQQLKHQADPDLSRHDLILHFSCSVESTPAGVRETAVVGGGEGDKPQMAVLNCLRRGQFGASLMATTPFSWLWYRQHVSFPSRLQRETS